MAIFSAKQNHLCNFSRGHYEEHFCEIIFDFDHTTMNIFETAFSSFENILVYPGVKHSISLLSSMQCNGMGYAWVTEDGLITTTCNFHECSVTEWVTPGLLRMV